MNTTTEPHLKRTLGLAGLTTFATSRTSSFVAAHPGARATGPFALTHGYQGAFALAAVLAFLGSAAALVLLRGVRAPQHVPAEVVAEEVS